MIDIYGSGRTVDELYGRNGLVALLEPYQRDYNRIMNLHRRHVDYATNGYLAVEDGSVDVDELTEEGFGAGKILVYRQGGNKPKIEKDAINTEQYLKSAEYCLNRMEQIAVDFFETHC